ncbi:heterogeneous nuclear ribonucleoprotein A0-like [Capsicum chacoense]
MKKLFVGGIAPETTEESLMKYFSQFGEITDSVIISNKRGSPRGYGFVTYAESEIANEVLEEDHIIDGRAVENFLLRSTLTVIFPLITTLRLGLCLKRIFCSVYKVLVKKEVPKEDMHVKRSSKTRKIFIGGLPRDCTEDDLKEHFSTYGYILRHRIMRDNCTGRSRGFGFVTFANEKAVEEVFSDGCMHELGGKQVKIERAEPIRADVEHASENWLHHGGSISKSYYGDCDSAEGFGCAYAGNTGAGHGGYGGYEGYGNYGGYGLGPTVFYPVYGGSNYVVGFGGAMYGSAGYGGSNYGAPGYYDGSTGGAMHGASGYVGSSYGTPVNYGGSTGGAMYGAAGYGGSSYGAPVNYGGSTGGATHGATGYGGSSYGAPINYGGSTGGAMYGAADYGGSSYGAPVYMVVVLVELCMVQLVMVAAAMVHLSTMMVVLVMPAVTNMGALLSILLVMIMQTGMTVVEALLAILLVMRMQTDMTLVAAVVVLMHNEIMVLLVGGFIVIGSGKSAYEVAKI